MKKNLKKTHQEIDREPIVFGYTRVSTERQNTEVQKYEIQKYCNEHGISVTRWIDEKISGTKDPMIRQFRKILKEMRGGDIIICTEISRLGRSLQSIWKISIECADKEVKIISLKEGHIFNGDTTGKFLISAFGYAAEIERNLISARTKEALEARKRAGVKLGRPVGRKNTKYKLDQHYDTLVKLLEKGVAKKKIARKLKVNISTVYDYLRMKLPEYYYKKKKE